MSGGEVGLCVRISRYHVDGNSEGSPLENVIGIGFRYDVGSSDGRVSGEEYVGIEVCATGGVLNGKSSGNNVKNPLGGVLGEYIGMII